MLKELLNYFHTAIKRLLHVILIPVVALLKAMIAGLQYIHDELEKA